ncbi:bifunctional riboflavin kinase/FAD synthetase [Bizionia gelidisalsuginis]|uniref:Riboflavin biosynthesis protein n=2 Tax=Bizionia TaxID=283785 RepID=A0A8H2QJM9_9FLAO|nr:MULTISPECIES: bifunctional riboflavin kinase/FAD synthetase [Bizionia]TYB76050.1 bifunctional riboflavin kinase/FAD synthetase [Bizionia saleffrena]TYC13553.1 bifunctional riboflavin kinase/FAD synthetase [Bizionia gelidisalsuginis]
MEALKTLKNNTVITIGTFDGVHIGHQKILQRLLKIGGIKNLEPTVLTFFPHPRMVLQKDAGLKLINSISEKTAILKQFGISRLVVKEFTKEFSRLTAEDFVEKILVKELKAKHIIIGYDHHFGRNRTADINDLKAFGKIYGFEVEEITKQDINDVAVSSTKIRKALLDGAITMANTYLGYNFFLTGTVVIGKGLGRTINYPTANLEVLENYKLIPKKGVYIVQSTINSETVFGMMNIGNNPTVNGDKQTIEVHFLDLDESLYGAHLKVELLHRLRDEIKFNSVEDLKEQLHRDKQHTLDFIAKNA